MSNYLFNIIVAWDILIMTHFGGKRNETVSSCMWTMEQDGKLVGRIMRPVIDFLLSWRDPHHCAASYFMEQRK